MRRRRAHALALKRRSARGHAQPPRAPAMEPEALRRLRRDDLKMSLLDFAARLGVSPKTVIRWEAGSTPISLARQLAIQALVSRAAAEALMASQRD